MTDIYVTILTNENDEKEVLPNMDGDNSRNQAQRRADYWESLGWNAEVGEVKISNSTQNT